MELKAPAGKFRVVGVDLFSHEDYLKGDYVPERKPTRSPTITIRNGLDQWMTSTTSTTIRARTSGAMRRSDRRFPRENTALQRGAENPKFVCLQDA